MRYENTKYYIRWRWSLIKTRVLRLLTKRWCWKPYGGADDGCSWKVLAVGGHPQEQTRIVSDYDCTGQSFCNHVDSYLWGWITIGHYLVDV
jgi:hypothetical protein